MREQREREATPPPGPRVTVGMIIIIYYYYNSITIIMTTFKIINLFIRWQVYYCFAQEWSLYLFSLYFFLFVCFIYLGRLKTGMHLKDSALYFLLPKSKCILLK